MIEVRAHPLGCVLPVRAQPGARRSGIVGAQAGSLKVAVTAPADQGKANQALVAALADGLGLKRAQIELLRGHGKRDKVFLVRGIPAPQLQTLLQALLGDEPEA